MFKKFTLEESVASQTQVKSSVARGLKKRIIEQYPMVEATLEEMMPKKAPVVLIQCRDEQKTQIVVVSEQPIFFCVRDGPMMPTLRLLHTYPCLLDGVRVVKGAIPYVMGGANVAAPGMTHANVIEENRTKSFEAGDPVAIYAEGMTLPMAIGVMKVPLADALAKGKGMAIDMMHYIDDGFWRTPTVSR